MRRQSHTALQHLLAKALAVHQLPIVRHGHRSLNGMQYEGLAINSFHATSRRVSCMADAKAAFEFLDRFVGEDLTDHANAFVRVKCMRMFSLAGHDAGHLLAAMLECDQSEADDLSDVDLNLFV